MEKVSPHLGLGKLWIAAGCTNDNNDVECSNDTYEWQWSDLASKFYMWIARVPSTSPRDIFGHQTGRGFRASKASGNHNQAEVIVYKSFSFPKCHHIQGQRIPYKGKHITRTNEWLNASKNQMGREFCATHQTTHMKRTYS